MGNGKQWEQGKMLILTGDPFCARRLSKAISHRTRNKRASLANEKGNSPKIPFSSSLIMSLCRVLYFLSLEWPFVEVTLPLAWNQKELVSASCLELLNVSLPGVKGMMP